MNSATFRMSYKNEGAAKFIKHAPRDITCEGTGNFWRKILRAVIEAKAISINQGLYGTHIGEGRENRDIGSVVVSVIERVRQFLGNGDRLKMIEVHFPISSDERFTHFLEPQFLVVAFPLGIQVMLHHR